MLLNKEEKFGQKCAFFGNQNGLSLIVEEAG